MQIGVGFRLRFDRSHQDLWIRGDGQISIDSDLLRRIDRDPEARKRGRSAFIRSAVELYLRARERRAVDAAIRRAYQADEDVLVSDIEELIDAQARPAE